MPALVDFTCDGGGPISHVDPVEVIIGGSLYRVACPKDVMWASLDPDQLWNRAEVERWVRTLLEPFQAGKLLTRMGDGRVEWLRVAWGLHAVLKAMAPHAAPQYDLLGMARPLMLHAHGGSVQDLEAAPMRRRRGRGKVAPGVEPVAEEPVANVAQVRPDGVVTYTPRVVRPEGLPSKPPPAGA